MAFHFDLDQHNAFHEKMKWPHRETCVCKSNLPAVSKEMERRKQMLDFTVPTDKQSTPEAANSEEEIN